MESNISAQNEPDGPDEDDRLFLDDEESTRTVSAQVPDGVPAPDPYSVAELPGVLRPTGEALRLNEAAALTAAHDARIIAVLGEQAAGKTTLFASIWESFLRGSYEDYLFAGSRTQPAFDRRCFDARVDSGRDRPETERTELRQANDRYILHLMVRARAVLDAQNRERPPIQHLLFPDLSGEDLREARQSSDIARSFPLIQRADHIVFLADGKRLASPELRHEAAANVKTLLRRLIEENVVDKSFVSVVVTKNDLVSKAGAEAQRYVDRLFKQIENEFRDTVCQLTTYRIAARPEDAPEIAVGVGQLFRQWLEISPYSKRMSIPPPTVQPSDRESVRWAHRLMCASTSARQDP